MAESFASALARTRPNKGGVPSLLDKIRAELSDKDRADLDAALADPELTALQIVKALADIGYEVSDSTMYVWCRKARRG